MAKNKQQKFKDLLSFKNTIQPNKEELLNNKFYLKGKWNNEFKNKGKIILELGCGKGEYSISLAKKNPNLNFIGIDIKGSRIWHGAKNAIENNLDNVRFLRTQIEFLPYCFAQNEVSEIWITFPDPQIKFRRRKKRLTSPVMLSRYRKILKKNSLLHLKTDSLYLHGYTLGVLEQIDATIKVTSHDIYNSELISKYDFLKINTFYEKQFLKNNNPITYICFLIN